MKFDFKQMIRSESLLWAVYALAAVAITAQRLLFGRSANGYTAYENYIIFKNSCNHLLQGLNPYGRFDAEHWDLYKYSPAFSLFMAPFSVLPDWAGLGLWNLLNALALLAALLRLPIAAEKRRFIAWFVLIEMITALQNSQSNGLTAAMILWAWIAAERGNPRLAGWWTAAGAFLKIFGGFAAIPALVYARPRQFVAALAVWGSVLALAPALVIGPEQLLRVYGWWWDLLRQDHAVSVGLSVAGWLESWFGWTPAKFWISSAGLSLLLGSIWTARHRPEHRILLWASVLIWVVIFNHKAESPTFIIAACGVALWYVYDPQPAIWKKILLWSAFVLVSLSPTDLFPPALRQSLIQPYTLKAVPCIAIWLLITWQLFQLPSKHAHSVRG